jgi:hypothetical protein
MKKEIFYAGGKSKVEGQVNKGTTFRIYLRIG